MPRIPFTSCAAICFLLAACSVKQPSYPYHLVPRSWVYSIKQHNDSIYFSTSEDGLFRFHPDHPETIIRVGRCRTLPFRSMVFRRDGSLLTSSYYAGVYHAVKDTLLPLRYAPYPAWSMKLDENGAFWLAAARGVLREHGDTVVRFKDVRDAHDVAFWGDTVAVAHMKGISLYDRETGRPVGDYCTGIVCWTLARFDSVLVAGGSNVCAIISARGCRLICVPPPGNMVWAIEKDSSGALILGTQKGLFRAGPRADTAECIGCAGQCVKSLLIDKKGRLWVGTFYRGR